MSTFVLLYYGSLTGSNLAGPSPAPFPLPSATELKNFHARLAAVIATDQRRSILVVYCMGYKTKMITINLRNCCLSQRSVKVADQGTIGNFIKGTHPLTRTLHLKPYLVADFCPSFKCSHVNLRLSCD